MSVRLLPMVCALLAGCCWAALGLSYKLSERLQCRATPFTLVFSLVAGVFTLGISFFETTAWTDPRLWGVALALGVLLYGAIELAARAFALGSATICWTVINLSVLVPIFLAHFLYREALYWIDPGILVLFILMLLVLARSMRGAGSTQSGRLAPFLLTLGVLFVANGTFMFGSKVKEALFSNANSAGFSAIAYLSCMGLAVLVWLLRNGGARITPGEWRAGTCAGLTSALGFLCFLAAMSLPAIVAFTLAQGISLLGGVVFTSLLYHERISAWKGVGLAIGLLVFLLTGFRAPIVQGLRAHHPLSQENRTPETLGMLQKTGSRQVR